jgi:hypothetical protein
LFFRFSALFSERFGVVCGLTSRTDYEVQFKNKLSAAACWIALASSRKVDYRQTKAEVEEQMRVAAEMKRREEEEAARILALQLEEGLI